MFSFVLSRNDVYVMPDLLSLFFDLILSYLIFSFVLYF